MGDDNEYSRPIAEAPKDGTPIEVLIEGEDGQDWVMTVYWRAAEQTTGDGWFPGGWVEVGDQNPSKVVCPDWWRPIRPEAPEQ